MKRIITICVLLISLFVTSCTAPRWCQKVFVTFEALTIDDEYFVSSNWYVNMYDFDEKYHSLYYDEICRLKDDHGMSCEEETKATPNSYSVTLFCEEYTIEITASNSIGYGFLKTDLCYYGKCGNIGAYEEYSNVVAFLNDFTKYAGYDTVTEGNEFERLYYEAQESGKGYSYNQIYYDSSVGSLGYDFQIKRQSDSTRYTDENFQANEYYWFGFCGLLKPLI